MTPRHATYQGRDTVPVIDGDEGFYGVNEKLDPAQLPQGIVARAKNCRFEAGRKTTRLGIVVMPCMKTDGKTPFDNSTYPICGGDVFSDPVTGQEWFLIAAEGKIWRTAPNNVAVEVPLPAGVVITTDVEFFQGFGQVILARGFGLAPLACSNLATGFDYITNQSSGSGAGTGTLPIPNFLYGVKFQNKLILAGDADLGYVSDNGNFTRYQIGRAYRVNEGNNDTLQTFYPFGEATLIAFKDKSIIPITNLVPDAAGDWSSAVAGDITRTHGLRAPKSVFGTGSDLWYWSTKGFTSLRLTSQNQIQAADVPLSDAMTTTVARINKYWEPRIVTRYVNNRAYNFVPLDDAQLLGANLVGGVYYNAGSPSVDIESGLLVNVANFVGVLTAGKKYKYTQGVNDVYTGTGGFSTAVRGSSVFTATGTDFSICGLDGQLVTASIQEVVADGVLNGIMVYDFSAPSPVTGEVTQKQVGGQWMGVDESGFLCVKTAWVATYRGEKRLFSIGYDGVIRLHEEGFADEGIQTVAAPYVDVMVGADAFNYPYAGSTIQVNGGTLVTAAAAATNSGAASWGRGVGGSANAAQARANIWTNSGRGYDPTSATVVWSAPNTTPAQKSFGLRFLATNGVVPVVTIDAVPQSISGYYTWAYLDFHSGSEITQVPIQDEVLTRGYTFRQDAQGVAHIGSARKRGLTAKLGCSTWNPTLAVAVLTDGVGEETVRLPATTRSNVRYYTPAADWDPTNANGDWGFPYREDYAASFDAGVGLLLGSGVNLDQHQEWEQPVLLGDARGRYNQLRITNTTGRLELRYAGLEALVVDRDPSVKV